MEFADELNTFYAEYKIIDGKKVPVIKARMEKIVHPDGRVDVIAHVPSLDMINKIGQSK